MPTGFAAIPPGPRWRIVNARVPSCLIPRGVAGPGDLSAVEISISGDRITALAAPGGLVFDPSPSVDLAGGIVFPGFVEIHTHLDKGHIWPRAANPDGTFDGALEAVGRDRSAHWSAADVRARMDFSLRCAHAHGTVAIRTHLDSIGPQVPISWPVFEDMRAEWAGRIALQAVSLHGIDMVADDFAFDTIVRHVRAAGGILGAVTYMVPDLVALIDKLVRRAGDEGLDLDIHADETQDPGAVSLGLIADAVRRLGYQGRVNVGHCCSLARQDDDTIKRTLDKVALAGVSVVSLPMCNMYLQDRHAGRTPRQRGITLLHEMKARGIAVSVSSDNTRDPFYAHGDLDALEVYREATRIAQLDHPVADWPKAITATPADRMGLAAAGRLAIGGPADLVLTRARSFTELLSRPQSDRTVIRHGRAIDTRLPDYAELDAVIGAPALS